MGSVFKYVADAALRTCGGEVCHHCERDDQPIYTYFGTIVDPGLAKDPKLAREEPDVSELCAECILSGNVRRNDTGTAKETVERFAADPVRAWAAFHQLPGVPLFLQNFDWPLCCGDWCEFTGSPTGYRELLKLQDSAQFWDRGPADDPRDFRDGGPPESYREISAFRCLTCGGKLYTDQFT